MNIEAMLLNRIKTAQADFAMESMRKPQNRDAFEYGYRVGVVAGYEAALTILYTLLDEEKHSDNDL